MFDLAGGVYRWRQLLPFPVELSDEGDKQLALAKRIVATGGVDAAVDRVRAHFDAGASHVCVQVLGASMTDVPESGWRDLAAGLNELD